MKNKSIWHILTVVCCCGMTISTLGLVYNSIGVFFSPLAESLGVGRGSVALLSTISTLANGFAAPLFVKSIKRFSLRKVMTTAILVMAGATMLLSLTTAVWQLYVLAAIQGVALMFFSSVPVTIIITNWFEEKHGVATGIAFCFSGVAGAVFSPIFNAFIARMGWRPAFVLLGALVMLFSLPGALFILRLDPSERGLLPYGASAPRQKPVAQTASVQPISMLSSAFLMLAVLSVFGCFSTGVSQNLPGFAESIRLSSATGAAMVSAVMIGNLSSKLLIGILSDIIGPIFACVTMLSACALALLMLVLFPTAPTVFLLAVSVLIGCCYSFGSVGLPLTTRYVFGSERYSAVYPRVNMLSNVGSACSIAIIGYIYDFTRSYSAAFLCCIGFIAIAITLLLMLNRKHAQ